MEGDKMSLGSKNTKKANESVNENGDEWEESKDGVKEQSTKVVGALGEPQTNFESVTIKTEDPLEENETLNHEPVPKLMPEVKNETVTPKKEIPGSSNGVASQEKESTLNDDGTIRVIDFGVARIDDTGFVPSIYGVRTRGGRTARRRGMRTRGGRGGGLGGAAILPTNECDRQARRRVERRESRSRGRSISQRPSASDMIQIINVEELPVGEQLERPLTIKKVRTWNPNLESNVNQRENQRSHTHSTPSTSGYQLNVEVSIDKDNSVSASSIINRKHLPEEEKIERSSKRVRRSFCEERLQLAVTSSVAASSSSDSALGEPQTNFESVTIKTEDPLEENETLNHEPVPKLMPEVKNETVTPKKEIPGSSNGVASQEKESTLNDDGTIRVIDFGVARIDDTGFVPSIYGFTRLRSRSRSVTPASEARTRERRPTVARRARNMLGMVAGAEARDPELAPHTPRRTKIQALKDCTPGGSVNVVGDITVCPTPGGRILRADEVPAVPVPLCMEILEKVEAMDVSDEEAEELMEMAPWHVQRWAKGLELEGRRGCSSRSPLTTSAAAVGPNAVVVAPEVDVRPSTSGVTKTVQPAPRGESGDGSDLDSEYDDEFDIFPAQTTAVTGTRKEIPDDEELEEPLRDIFDNIGRGMDDEVDRLSGITDGFEWVQDFESFRGVPEAFSGPTPGPIQDYDSAYDAFIDIWDEDIIDRIVLETNRYAKQTIDALKSTGVLKPSSRLHQWVDTNVNEIMVLLGVFMFMAIDPRPSLHEYWSLGVLGMSNFRRLMSYNRYILLNKFLHFVDNSDASQNLLQTRETDSANVASRRLFKLMPIIKHLEKKFDCLYNLGRDISVDESLTLFKGRLSWVQTIRSKAARFGIKSYELCESQTGYMARFQFYTDKSDRSLQDPSVSADLGRKSTKVVLELLQGLERRGHCVTMDNFYNCPALARYLKRSGFDCLGTLRTNRRNVPNDIAKVPENVPKGTIIARQCGDVSIIAWKDSKLVSIISTFHNDDTFVESKAGKVQVKPVCVRDYNSTMGRIDLKDQKLSMYLLERKRGMKWYVKMYKRLLNVSIHNALIMFVRSLERRNKPAMTHREFCYELAQSLVDRHRPPQRLEISEPVGQLKRLRRDIMHVPKVERGNVRKRCVICLRMKIEKKVRSQCTTCGVFMCFENCWVEWHSAEQLKAQERGRKRRRDE